MLKLTGVITMLALALLLGQAALAEQGRGEGRGQGGKQGRGEGQRRRPPVVFGVLQSVSGSTWTIKPQIPPHMRDRAEEKGKELPKLPDQITVSVGEQTKFWLNGAASNASAFKAGDEIVVKLGKPGQGEVKVAEAVADPETAREFILEKMKQHREGGKGKGKGGKGKGGQGQRGAGQGPRVVFGTVKAANSSSLTIKPEVPAFISEKLPKRAEKLAGRLPDSVTVALSAETKYFVDKQEQGGNPFSTGAKVAILPVGQPGSASARVVSDYASAQAKLEQRIEKRQQKREQRREKLQQRQQSK